MTRKRDIYIGDIQGCLEAFFGLLDKLGFDPAADRLCLAGDLVNRGGQSLEVLREIVALGEPHFTVLGNHDLHLLAYAHVYPDVRKPNGEFDRILGQEDSAELLAWLRRQPMLWLNADDRIALVHAGLDPRWDPAQARACAGEVEKALRGPQFGKFIDNMYGNKPDFWDPGQQRFTRLRTITNVLARTRFVRPDGRLELNSSGDPANAPKGYRPWFELLDESWAEWTIVFGHWSQLGHHDSGQAICLDSGCVWGNRLTALIVEDGDRRIESVDCNY